MSGSTQQPTITLDLDWNSDITVTPNGSIRMCSGWDLVRERIIRRFLTNAGVPLPDGTTTPPDYVFSPSYGLSGGALIDQNPDANWRATFTRRVREAVAADSAADPGALPSIRFLQPTVDTLQVVVTVTLVSGQQGNFALTIG